MRCAGVLPAFAASSAAMFRAARAAAGCLAATAAPPATERAVVGSTGAGFVRAGGSAERLPVPGAGAIEHAAVAPPWRPRHRQPGHAPAPSSGAGTPSRQMPGSPPQRPSTGGACTGCTTWPAQPAAAAAAAASHVREATVLATRFAPEPPAVPPPPIARRRNRRRWSLERTARGETNGASPRRDTITWRSRSSVQTRVGRRRLRLSHRSAAPARCSSRPPRHGRAASDHVSETSTARA